MATHFPLLSYHVDTSNWTSQEAQDVGFTKMYGRNCHPSGTGFRSGPWTISADLMIASSYAEMSKSQGRPRSNHHVKLNFRLRSVLTTTEKHSSFHWRLYQLRKSIQWHPACAGEVPSYVLGYTASLNRPTLPARVTMATKGAADPLQHDDARASQVARSSPAVCIAQSVHGRVGGKVASELSQL